MTTFWLSLPMLAVGFVVGIVMSLMQILTSIQDSSFSTVPAADRVSGRAAARDAVDADQADHLHRRRCSAIWAGTLTR